MVHTKTNRRGFCGKGGGWVEEGQEGLCEQRNTTSAIDTHASARTHHPNHHVAAALYTDGGRRFSATTVYTTGTAAAAYSSPRAIRWRQRRYVSIGRGSRRRRPNHHRRRRRSLLLFDKVDGTEHGRSDGGGWFARQDPEPA